MDLFNVYKRWNIEPVRGQGSTLWDAEGQEYLDLYGRARSTWTCTAATR